MCTTHEVRDSKLRVETLEEVVPLVHSVLPHLLSKSLFKKSNLATLADELFSFITLPSLPAEFSS